VRHTRLQQVAPGPACVPGGHIITSYSARRGRSGAWSGDTRGVSPWYEAARDLCLDC